MLILYKLSHNELTLPLSHVGNIGNMRCEHMNAIAKSRLPVGNAEFSVSLEFPSWRHVIATIMAEVMDSSTTEGK